MKTYHPLTDKIIGSPKASETEFDVAISRKELDRIIKKWLKEAVCGEN